MAETTMRFGACTDERGHLMEAARDFLGWTCQTCGWKLGEGEYARSVVRREGFMLAEWYADNFRWRRP